MMHRDADRFYTRGGFTLIELLLGIAVGAVVLVVIQTTFFGALRLHNTTHARIDSGLEVERALGIVRRDLAGLMLPGGTLTGHLQTTNFSSTMTGFSGERVSPDFVTNSGKIDGLSPFAEAQQVAYYLAPSEGSNGLKDLVRLVNRNLLPVQELIPHELVLLRGVLEASVLFYDGFGWTDGWDSEATSTLPTALKFSLTLASPDGAQRPLAPMELVVPVMATTTATQAQTLEEAAL